MGSQDRDDGYRGIWSYRGSSVSDDEYGFVHYSGGFATFCAKHVPMACFSAQANKTFFCYAGTRQDTPQILIMVSHFDHATGTVPRPTILLDKGTDDAHDNPVLMLDGQGFVWVFASAHGTARPAYVFKSRRPHSTDSFDLIEETNFSYPQPWWVPGRGFLFLHTRYVQGNRFLYWMTSGDGVCWSEPCPLARMVRGHYQISWERDGKVGTAFNYHPADGGACARTNLYYLETVDFGETWTNAQGERMATPLETVCSAALVREYEAEGLQPYLKDLNFDARGAPVILYVTSCGIETGPQHGPRRWTTARRTGGEWEILSSIASDNNYDTGCLHVEEDGLWRIIGPTETGPQPYNTGGEVAVWTSSDHGATWRRERLVTRNSPYNHSYVRRPVAAHPDFYAFWADGHARRVSDSRLYFCDKTGQRVFRLPPLMTSDRAEPEELG